jgi:hypothetical protein
MESALALGIAELLGVATDDRGRQILARDCTCAENVVAGTPSSGVEQSSILRTRHGHVMLLDCTDFTAEHIPFDINAAGLQLLVINTNTPSRPADHNTGLRRARLSRLSDKLGPRVLRATTAAPPLSFSTRRPPPPLTAPRSPYPQAGNATTPSPGTSGSVRSLVIRGGSGDIAAACTFETSEST